LARGIIAVEGLERERERERERVREGRGEWWPGKGQRDAVMLNQHLWSGPPLRWWVVSRVSVSITGGSGYTRDKPRERGIIESIEVS